MGTVLTAEPLLAWWLIISLIMAGAIVWIYMLLIDERELRKAYAVELDKSLTEAERLESELHQALDDLAQNEGIRPAGRVEVRNGELVTHQDSGGAVHFEAGQEYRAAGSVAFGFRSGS